MMEAKQQIAPGAGKLGMKLFLLSLSVLFIGSMVGYLVVRSRAVEWPPEGMPRLPSGLWISTLIIFLSSGAIESALRSIRNGKESALRWGLVVTLLLGFAFLIAQLLNWSNLIGPNVAVGSNLYTFTFFMLTGLHAAHVIGGLVQLVFVTARAHRGLYSAEHHAGVLYGRMYWHFLAVVWLVMFILMFVAA